MVYSRSGWEIYPQIPPIYADSGWHCIPEKKIGVNRRNLWIKF